MLSFFFCIVLYLYWVINMIRKRIVFKGRVQGVGFRFTAVRYASHLGLSGWVKNMYDGSVLMEVQGHLSLINQLMNYLNNDHYIRIDEMNERNIDIKESESGFSVKY